MSLAYPHWDGHATAATTEIGPYTSGEKVTAYRGRTKLPAGRTGLLYFHGFGTDAYSLLEDEWQPMWKAHADAVGIPVLTADLGGFSQWATSDVIGVSGFADDAFGYATGAPHMAIRADKIAVQAASMGTTNAFPWCWNRASQLRAVAMLGPIVWLEQFYTDAAVFQGAIDSDWGGHGNFVAALDSIDPWRNIDLIRPWAHRLRLWYASEDEFINPDDVRAFAELVGCEATEIPGVHADLIGVDPGEVAAWTLATMRDRSHAYIAWDETDYARFSREGVTQEGYPGPINEYSFTTEPTGAGRSFVVTRTVPLHGNDRHLYILDELSAPDTYVSTVWSSEGGGRVSGQQGNIHRVEIDEDAGTYSIWIAWHNILFGVPWIINRGIWTGDLAYPSEPSAGTLTQVGTVSSTPAGLRLSAGGAILASSRSGGVVTIVVDADDADAHYRSGVLDILLPGIGSYTGLVDRIGPNHMTFPLAGADVISGGVGSWADFHSCFPYVADTRLIGTTFQGRFYKPGTAVPEWGDTDWGFTFSGAGLGGTDGYGGSGFMIGHVGLFDGFASGTRVLTGPLTVDEQ